jgi:adenine-specific DNA-methyltransferase
MRDQLMAKDTSRLETLIEQSLIALAGHPLQAHAAGLFEVLGYRSPKTVALDGTPENFLKLLESTGNFRRSEKLKTGLWKQAHFLFQLTNDEIPALAAFTKDMFLSEQDYRQSIVESFVFIALDLQEGDWKRADLVTITREINRAFPMPAIILFRTGSNFSICVIDRRQSKRDNTRDVIEKRVSVIKDIDLEKPHRAHVDILADIALSNIKLKGKGTPTNFRDLYDAWIERLSAQTLNKRFYDELAYWFLWSSKEVTFPTAAREKDKDEKAKQNQIATIRMLTRLIFVWFIKERKLVPDEFFELNKLAELLKEKPETKREESTFYKAILQNLFFATLNTEDPNERGWRTSAAGKGFDGQYLVHTRYRYKDMFKAHEKALELFRKVPFLNGGLFECLDREISDRDIERNKDLQAHVVQEGSHKVIRIDGFSDKPQNPLHVPNKIFFAVDEAVDLNDDYATKGKKYTAQGLIELFQRYKFTVEENTPVEEEVALDPELLGKVFENLLASYNTDTRTTARKKSGSFYTPREVVDFMVDEALISHFSRALEPAPEKPVSRKAVNETLDLGPIPGELDLVRNGNSPSPKDAIADWRPKLEALLNPAVAEGNPFTPPQTDALISSIENLRALDPACGSGAFPMGLLQKLIHVLKRLDPDNSRWKSQNRKPYERRLAEAETIVDAEERDKKIEEETTALQKLDRDFSDANYADYARKLYLIEKCIYGVDIQPIAVQIAKLRFFISLIVSQKIDPATANSNITALPNLETKLVAANSLIPIERPEQADLFRNKAIEAKERELSAMQARYFGARTVKTKRKRRDDINTLRDELAELLKKDLSLPEADAKKMAAWDQFDQNSAAPFFDPEWMFGLTTKFDITIGNPPYVRQEEIKDQKPALEKHYKGSKALPGSYSGTADLYVYFIQRSIELLNPGGAFAFITSNKWYRAKYGERLRNWLNRQAEIKTVIDFGDADVFDAIAYPTILVATRRKETMAGAMPGEMLRVMNWPRDMSREDVPKFPEHMKSLHFTMPQKALTVDGWQLEPQVKRQLLERIRAAGNPLGEYVEGNILYGIKTGLNRAYIVSTAEKESLIAEHPSSSKVLKPLLMGRDIKRWGVEPDGNWIIQIESSENAHHPWSNKTENAAEQIFSETFPAVARHLFKFKSDLKKRTDQGKYFWELRSCDYWNKFDQPKIFAPEIQNSVQYAPDLEGFRCVNKACIIVHSDWKFLLPILNSTVSWWFSQQIFTSKQGGFYEFTRQFLFQIPVPRYAIGQKTFVSSVADVVGFKKGDARMEQLLNGFVYELFFRDDLQARGLTLFDEAERAGLGKLEGLEGEELVKAADEFVDRVFKPSHPLYAMLFDLQALDVVRIIEGKE